MLVGNPCSTNPCLPGTVYALLADGVYYYLNFDCPWIKENNQWKQLMEKKQHYIKVTGYVHEKLDIKGQSYYEIEVVSLEKE